MLPATPNNELAMNIYASTMTCISLSFRIRPQATVSNVRIHEFQSTELARQTEARGAATLATSYNLWLSPPIGCITGFTGSGRRKFLGS